MSVIEAAAIHPHLALFEHEIERFLHFAQRRSSTDRYTLRRKYRRYHRSWPLLIFTDVRGGIQEYSAALHDASAGGIGFVCDRMLQVDSQIFVKLFWHDAAGLYIPAVVHHVTPGPSGILVGAEYTFHDAGACEKALAIDQVRWSTQGISPDHPPNSALPMRQ